MGRWRGLGSLGCDSATATGDLLQQDSSMAELLEQSWKKELTCGVDALAKLDPSLAAFPFPVSLLSLSDLQIGLALGVSV